MTLDAQQIEFFRTNGYLCVPGVYDSSEVDSLRRTIYRIYRKFVPENPDLDDLNEPWNDVLFDKKMIKLRGNEPKVFGALYDAAQCTTAVMQFATDMKVAAIAAAVLDDEPENLSNSGILLRMDTPGDTRNVIAWHQDRSYFPQNFDGNNGMVVSIALQDISCGHGAVELCPKSHNEGFVEPVVKERREYGTTEQRGVPESMASKYETAVAECKKGDITLLHMNLFHRSGVNTSSQIRFSTISRFHKIMSDDFVPFRLVCSFNEFMMKQAKPKIQP